MSSALDQLFDDEDAANVIQHERRDDERRHDNNNSNNNNNNNDDEGFEGSARGGAVPMDKAAALLASSKSRASGRKRTATKITTELFDPDCGPDRRPTNFAFETYVGFALCVQARACWACAHSVLGACCCLCVRCWMSLRVASLPQRDARQKPAFKMF